MKKIYLILFFLINANQVFSDTKMAIGLEVYKNKAQCGTCHTLRAADSLGQIGPNLDQLRPSMVQIINSVKNGIGVMPRFEGILSEEEIDAVAYFVAENAGK